MAAGIGAVAFAAKLPATLPCAAALLGAALFFLCAQRRLAPAWRAVSIGCLAFTAGIAWGVGYGSLLRRALLPVALEQQSLTLTGTVEGIVERYADGEEGGRPTLRWSLRVEHCTRAGGDCCPPAGGDCCMPAGSDCCLPVGRDCGVALQRVLLSAYQTTLQPSGGERWQLRVKLKRPRGFANPGGFDYEAWLVAQRIGAVGYVEEGAADNRRLANAPPWSIDRWRERLKARIARHAPRLAHADLLAGLLIGDGSDIPAAAWQTFRVTGTVHLFVVSGLQIAFTGGLALWIARLWWRSPWGHSRRRDHWLGILPAFAIAILYSLLAGFGLPIQRALIMFGCYVWALAARRDIGPATWSLALLLVSLGNPLAALDAGFWFSFGTVAVLMVVAGERRRREGRNWRERLRRHGALWWRVQGALFVGALPLSLAITGQFTLLALPANALAVPWSTLLTLPLAFVALLLEAFAPQWAGAWWWLADLTLQVLWAYLCWLQQWRAFAVWQLPGSGVFGLVCATLCAVLYLLPRGTPGRALGWLLLLPIGWPDLPRIAPGDCRLTVIDVGQGLSVLVETADHRLLYDTGPPFGPQRSVAELTVAPLLHHRGVRTLDAVVISHRDSDHAGGWPTIAAQFDVRSLLVGEPLKQLDKSLKPSLLPQEAPAAEPCRAGMQWRWDGVEFAVLHPPSGFAAGNDSSCVLRVRAGGATLLLPGDIERRAEYAVYDQLAPVDILLAPHHGSRSSSTAAFVARTQPRHVVFSTGYRNRFGHPHASVAERYAQSGAELLNTADSGALIFDVKGGRVVRVERWRERLVHYWD